MGGSDRETTITQSVPVVVLAAITVANIHEPKCRDPDVHIILPSLLQLKAISERFTKLALAPSSTLPTTRRNQSSENDNPTSLSSHSRLILAANGHGGLKIGVETPNLKIESKWEGLTNPQLDPGHVEGGEEAVREHASTKMREVGGWATVRVEGRDWGRVLGVGRLGGRVIACEHEHSPTNIAKLQLLMYFFLGFCHDHALILYVYLTNTDSEDSVLTVCALFCSFHCFPSFHHYFTSAPKLTITPIILIAFMLTYRDSITSPAIAPDTATDPTPY